MLNDHCFKDEHRRKSSFFSRNRALTFRALVVLMLRKGMKSMQLALNEFFERMDADLTPATSSAFAQARSKMLHTAFIELNQKAVVETLYESGEYERFRGFRLVGVDGSKLILPNEREIRSFFGTIKIANQHGTVRGEHPVCTISVLYDLLNNVAIDSILGHARSYEVDLAVEHVENFGKTGDLVIFDRNYPSYRFLSFLISRGMHFVGRCSRSSFKEAREMFVKHKQRSRAVKPRPHHAEKKRIENLGLPMEIGVRFVRVELDTGEVEVLVTSLCDEASWPSEIFKELYHMRWGVETFYGILKNRLGLENFTGKTIESVLQDFYSTVFVSGLASILTGEAKNKLAEKNGKNKYRQNVNKSVAFNAIKNQALDLLLKDLKPEVVLERLNKLFLGKPVSERRNRKFPRKTSPTASLIHHKRSKKIVF